MSSATSSLNGLSRSKNSSGGTSVFGSEVPVKEAPPRPGDAVGAYANVDKVAALLGWRASESLDDAIASALAWAEKRHEVLGYE